jgi:hypothetical protein
MSDCVPCNTAPSPCNCSLAQTCVQTPRTCSACPRNICIADPDADSRSASHPGHHSSFAAPVGGAIAGLVAGLLIILSLWILYRRNLLPPFFTTLFQSNARSPKHFSKKHPHHINKNKNKKQSSSSSAYLSKPQLELPPTHQSVIYLPTDTRDPNTPSVIESDGMSSLSSIPSS